MADPTPSEPPAADVFLDPDTAHPALHVSKDKRSLHWANTRQNLPDNPKRFQENYCVLGCESFTSGRHFWEVEVTDRSQWCVGVCRDNVQRKLRVEMKPENGFWILGLSHGNDYVAFTDPPTKLTLAQRPKKVGVFLDYEVGEVSFYNAIDGSHLFTFRKTSFSVPLRPVFQTETMQHNPLGICPAQKAVRSLLPA